ATGDVEDARAMVAIDDDVALVVAVHVAVDRDVARDDELAVGQHQAAVVDARRRAAGQRWIEPDGLAARAAVGERQRLAQREAVAVGSLLRKRAPAGGLIVERRDNEGQFKRADVTLPA